jgi:hypothetical protein
MQSTGALEPTLRRYVLGTLDEEPRLKLEERLVTDPDVFDALGIVEDEVTEEYLEGRLPDGDRRDYERHFLAHPGHRQQVAFLRGLKQRAATTREPAPGFWSRLADPIASAFSWQPAWAGAVAALLIVSMAATAWFAVRSVRLDDRLETVHSQQLRGTQDQAQLQGRVDALAGETRSLRARLDEEVQRRVQAEARLAQLEPGRRPGGSVPLHEPSSGAAPGVAPRVVPERAPGSLAELVPPTGSMPAGAARAERGDRGPAAMIPTFALAAGALRSDGSLVRVAVPDGALVVQLQLALPADDYPFHRATLYDAQAEEILTQARLRASGAAGRTSVVLILPTHLLSRGDYQIKLSGVAESGDVEPLATYNFRVTTP